MKRYFVTGLIILLPLALTVAVLAFIFNFLTEPFVGIVESIMARYDLNSYMELGRGLSKVVILILLFFFTVSLGILTRWFLVTYFVDFWELIIRKIPFIGSVYRTFKDVVSTLFNADTKSFKQVVLVKFPNKDTSSIGFVTNENDERVTVFIPTAPNPTSGFTMMYDREDVVFLDMKVEEAFKYVISCGVIQPVIRAKND